MSRFLTQRTSPSYVYDTCSNIRTEREAEDKRLEETFSSQLAIDDGVDAYEDVGSGEVYSEADEVKGESAGDKNQRYSWMQITTITMTAGTVTSMAMQVGRAREQRARIPYTPAESAAIRRRSHVTSKQRISLSRSARGAYLLLYSNILKWETRID